MECFFAHLPPGLSEILDIKEPAIRLINSNQCPHHPDPCSKKSKGKPCCLGDSLCENKCPNRGEC